MCIEIESGNGQFSSSTMVMSSKIGQDGKMHTQKFMSNSVGDRSRNVLQTDQAYDNSATGIRKRAQERQHGKIGHKLIAEQNAAGAQQVATPTGGDPDRWNENCWYPGCVSGIVQGPCKSRGQS